MPTILVKERVFVTKFASNLQTGLKIFNLLYIADVNYFFVKIIIKFHNVMQIYTNYEIYFCTSVH